MIKKRAGFTLVEVMVTVVLLGIVLISISMLLEAGIFRWGKITGRNELSYNLHSGIASMVDEIKMARKVDSTSTDKKLIIHLAKEGSPGTDTIEFGLEDDDLVDHNFVEKGKKLYRKLNGGSAQPLANFISELEFEYDTLNKEEAKYITIKVKGLLEDGEEISFQTGAELKWQSFAGMTE